MDKETELLSRLAANHLHLAQFEPLRAILTSLRTKNPDLALAVLQTIVSNSGRFDNLLWSQSCPNPSLLTFLSTLELLQFNNPTSHTWRFDSVMLRLRVEFLLLIQLLIDRATESLRKNVDLDKFEKEEEEESGVEESSGGRKEEEEVVEEGYLGNFEGLKDESGELGVLDKVLEFGVKRLKGDVDLDGNEVEGRESGERSGLGGVVEIDEAEMMSLRKVILDNANVFDALCSNVERQMKGMEVENENSGLEITLRGKSVREWRKRRRRRGVSRCLV
ncbi:unnamed protein product [Dovyalis caffra]|uniref:Uncharacterized protein n=1 Tax=Dovyalis caffra TaxID=77055 RepID=A0AAV1SP83_9ROSI|nr:unnamed protein product [Dovyalis caffra]